MKCVSSIHKDDGAWPEATIAGTFRNPYVKDAPTKRTNYCANCAAALKGVGLFAPELFTPDEPDA